MKNYMSISQFRELCIKELTGNISESELNEFHYLKDESPELKKEYENLKKIWIESKPEDFNLPDLNNEWVLLNNRLKVYENDSAGRETLPEKSGRFITFFSPGVKIAAAFIVLIAIAAVFIFKVTSGTPEIVTQFSENKSININLPDGSSVTLNKNSSVKFPEEFQNNKREILLKGEAFFSVVKNEKPFIVITGNAKTTVLGTKFNVWTNAEKTEVFVKEGKVNVTGNNKGVTLTENEISRIVRNNVPSNPEKVEADFVLDWLEGKMIFRKTPLNKVIEKLEKYYNQEISLQTGDDENLSKSLTGKFENKNLDSVLTMVCLAMDLDYEKKNNLYIIKSRADSGE